MCTVLLVFLNWDTGIFLLVAISSHKANKLVREQNVLGEISEIILNLHVYVIWFYCKCGFLPILSFIDNFLSKLIFNALLSVAENISVYYTYNLANEAELDYIEIPWIEIIGSLTLTDQFY